MMFILLTTNKSLFLLILYHLVIAMCEMSHYFIHHNQIEASTRGIKNKNINQDID